MTLHMRCEEALHQLERLLRDCDEDVAASPRGHRATRTRRRNAVNAACNALHRAMKA